MDVDLRDSLGSCRWWKWSWWTNNVPGGREEAPVFFFGHGQCRVVAYDGVKDEWRRVEVIVLLDHSSFIAVPDQWHPAIGSFCSIKFSP